jgi:hypothetical protein
LLFGNLQWGIGDISENGEKVVDSCNQIRNNGCGSPPHFYFLQEGGGQLFKMIQPGSGDPLEMVCMHIHYWFDYPLAFARPLGEL